MLQIKNTITLRQLKMTKAVHIVSFDVPYPANYGGVIDVYFKLLALQKKGIDIYLHCFDYGRGRPSALDKLCKKVYYYQRNTSLLSHFHVLPYILQSRKSAELIHNLLQTNDPILCEGLHTCALLSHPLLKDRKKIFRESNVEHEYYRHLARVERNPLKKIYFYAEALKLSLAEKLVTKSNLALCVSETDTRYFKNTYPQLQVEYLPSFHGHERISIEEGKGDYILYHGKLSVAENKEAALYLVKEVFAQVQWPVIIAGMDPDNELQDLITPYPHIRLLSNPTEDEMNRLIRNAHIHCLYTHQATGLKLKLLNVLYSGRFCICNDLMVSGTPLSAACIIANSPSALVVQINNYMNMPFTAEHLIQREKILAENYNDEAHVKKLINWLF